MTAPGQRLRGAALPAAHAFDIEATKMRLAADGGYQIIHESAGLEIGVYVLVAPEPDHQQPHDDDEVYVVLEGRGTLDIEGEQSISVKATPSSFPPAPSTSSSGTSS